jgi:hypothetical protein
MSALTILSLSTVPTTQLGNKGQRCVGRTPTINEDQASKRKPYLMEETYTLQTVNEDRPSQRKHESHYQCGLVILVTIHSSTINENGVQIWDNMNMTILFSHHLQRAMRFLLRVRPSKDNVIWYHHTIISVQCTIWYKWCYGSITFINLTSSAYTFFTFNDWTSQRNNYLIE